MAEHLPPVAVPAPEDLTRVVALDGPAGTGKSTVARLTAETLGWRFVDTGATYRAATLKVLRAGADPGDATAVEAVVSKATIALDTDPHAPTVHLDGEDVSEEIRSAAVTAAVSAVSAVPAVRRQLIEVQRVAMGTEGAVVEGRDIATVVAPLAAVKAYLDARPEVRAARRAAQTSSTGDLQAGTATRSHPTVADVQRALEHRDALDNQTNELQASDGAVHIDTSDLTLPEVVAAVVALVESAGLVEPHARRGRDASGDRDASGERTVQP